MFLYRVVKDARAEGMLMIHMYNYLCYQYCTRQTSFRCAYVCLRIKFSKCSKKKKKKTLEDLLNADIRFSFVISLSCFFHFSTFSSSVLFCAFNIHIYLSKCVILVQNSLCAHVQLCDFVLE